MSKSLYNPFMVNLDFASRMSRFGGGGGGARPGTDELARNEAAEKAAAAKKAAEEKAKKEAAAKAAAAKKAAEEKAKKEAAAKAKAAAEAKAAAAKKKAEELARQRDLERRKEVASKLQSGLKTEADVMRDLQDSASNVVKRRITAPASDAVSAETQDDAGTMTNPMASASASAIPEAFTYRPDYTGTTMANLTSASQQDTRQLIENVMYTNELGQTVGVTEVNGVPTTYVPPGFTRTNPSQDLFDADYQARYDSLDDTSEPAPSDLSGVTGGLLSGAIGSNLFAYSEGGTVEDVALEGMYRMATKFLGYEGPKTREALEQFQQSNPSAASKMNSYGKAMLTAANKGGLMHKKGFAAGGMSSSDLNKMQASAVKQTMQPRQATVDMLQPTAADFIAPTAGQTAPLAPMVQAATVGSVTQAQQPTATPAAQVTTTTAAPQVQAQTAATQAAQGQVTQQAQTTAVQQQDSSVSNLQAAQGQAVLMDNPVQREIQSGELISGVADAQKAAQFNEQIQAAEATPTKQATVQGQLEGLMQQFEGGETPAWAAGSMRNAMATLSARGLGASSMAGQAVIQATMEAALPIAMADAQTQAQFESQNLSNRQQRAMLAAQQRAQFMGQEFDQAFQARVANSSRIGDVANMNFTAEQQVALENSRAANTMELNNLSNRQAKVMAEAAALANLDMANLSNRQQAAVQNAQSFLQVDMANLSNEQQTAMFKAQQNVQALFTDQAANNAASQFNASSQNQTDQFFANLGNQTSQFNAAQSNAMNQFNVNSVNALREFNSEIQQQRDLFNAQNGLVVAQSNAQWRQSLATINNASMNESNADFARTMNGLTEQNMAQIWQRERDIMSFTFQSENNNADRATSIALQKLAADSSMSVAEARKSSDFASAAGSLIGAIFS